MESGHPKLEPRAVTVRVVAIWALILACGWVVMRLMEPSAPQAPPELSRTPGVRLFYRYECGKCHTVVSLPGATGKMGPPLDHVGRTASQRRPGMSARDYLKESLLKPQAYVVEGYLKTMPAFDRLPPAELDELVTYLESLQ